MVFKVIRFIGRLGQEVLADLIYCEIFSVLTEFKSFNVYVN